MFMVPVGLCAVRFGVRGGFGTAALGTVLAAFWYANGQHFASGFAEMLMHITVFMLVGGLVGTVVDRKRAIEDGYRSELEKAVCDRTAELEQRSLDLEAAELETLRRLALAAEYRDDDTYQHTEGVGRPATAARQRRRAGRDPCGTVGSRERNGRTPALGTASRGSARLVARPAQRRRRPPRRTRPTPQPDRDRTRGATRSAATATSRRAAPPLQPLPPLELPDTRPAGDDPRPPLAWPTHTGSDRGSRPTRTRDPQPRTRTRPKAPRRARRRPDRRRTTDRHLVTPRPHLLRSRLRTTRRRRTPTRLKRTHKTTPPQPSGDRQLNRALHTVILHRRQHDTATKSYIARRIAEGKTTRDAVRLLKRYLARHLYRLMQNAIPLTT
jgi:hypothetical protein